MRHIDPDNVKEWEKDCLRWRGRILNGYHAHWCYEWDGLPIDETTPEWPCNCRIADPTPNITIITTTPPKDE